MWSDESYSDESYSRESWKFDVVASIPPGGAGGGGGIRSRAYVPWYRDKPQEKDLRAQLQEEDDIAVALIQVIYAAGFFD